MRASLASGILLLFALTSYAMTPTTNASLNGAYSFQVSGAHQHFWGKQLFCSDQLVFMGGSTVSGDATYGTANFNGRGSVSGTFTQDGQFDLAASNATVSCASNGHAVYDSPVSGTITGTYSIQSNGTGAMTLNLSNGKTGGFVLKLSGQCPTGITNTVFMTLLRPDNSVDDTGVMRLQSTC